MNALHNHIIPLLLTADSKEELNKQHVDLDNTLKNHLNVRELASRLLKCCTNGKYRKVVTFNEISEQLETSFESSMPISNKERPFAFMFSGFGNQYIGMARGLYEQIPYFKELFDNCCDYLEFVLGHDLREIVFSGEDENLNKKNDFQILLSKSKDTTVGLLNQTKYSHTSLFVVEYCLAKTLISLGIIPQALIGHSIGEYVAATISGVIKFRDALNLIARRALLIEKLQPGSMITVLANKDEISSILNANDSLYLATKNSPISSTISGTPKDIDWAKEQLNELDIIHSQLRADRAFHSPLMAPIENEFKNLFLDVRWGHPNIPYLSNVTGDWITEKQATDPYSWFLHTCNTVHFSEGIQKLLDIKDCILLEIGPGQVLTGFVYQQKFHEHNSDVMVLPTLKDTNHSEKDVTFLLHTLCKIWANGGAVDWNNFYHVF